MIRNLWPTWIMFFYVFFCNFMKVNNFLYCLIILLHLISSFLLTRSLLVPYAYVSIESNDCILLSFYHHLNLMQGMIHIWRPWKLSNFQDLPLPCSSTSKFLQSPWRWTSKFKQTSPLRSPNDNSLKENIIQRGPLYVSRCFV